MHSLAVFLNMNHVAFPLSSYSDEFVLKSQKVIALLPPPLTSFYSVQNEKLTYNELINCCEEVAISLK